MKKNIELGFFDYLLVMVSCSISLLALGESLSRHKLSAVLAIGACVSIGTGYFLSRSKAVEKIRDYDGYIWSALAVLATFLARPVNGILPEEGFPFQLFAGTWLSCLLIFCGFAAWRDQTLLFLNLPCLSAFALVGTFDTFAPATLLFFVFLLSSSLLYARIHQRAMIRRAVQAGVEDPALLHRDAWRWMAGPEWALASAGVIVVFSLLFGPILKLTLEPVSGTVKVSLPQSVTAAATSTNNQVSDTQVGRGPLALSENVLFKVKMDRPDYLRSAWYVTYTGNGWSRLRLATEAAGLGLEPKVVNGSGQWMTGFGEGAPMEPMTRPVERKLSMRPESGGQSTYVAPGPIRRLLTPNTSDFVFTASGFVFSRGDSERNWPAEIVYLEPGSGTKAGSATLPRVLAPIERLFTSTSRIKRSVADFARKAVEGATTDLEKAEKLSVAIGQATEYSLKVPPLDSKEDAVEQFLFNTKKGYCDLYASSMTICARAVGLPARYVEGFIVQTQPDIAGYYAVRMKDAHAWCEVFFEGVGWMKFDPTEHTREAEGESGSRPKSWFQGNWAQQVFSAILGALALTAVALWFRQPRAKLVNKPGARPYAVRLTNDFDRAMLHRTGVVRRFSLSHREYVEAVADRLGESLASAQAIVVGLEQVCYSQEESDKATVTALGAQIKVLRRAPRANAQEKR